MKKIFIILFFIGFTIVFISCNTQKEKYYKVTWQNYDGTILQCDEKVLEGTIPSYKGSTPKRVDDEKYHYVFKNWDKEIKTVYKDICYIAVFSASELGNPQSDPIQTDPETGYNIGPWDMVG